LWELDLEALKWTSLGKPGGASPPPRSGCQLALHADAGVLFLYGGAPAHHPATRTHARKRACS
jgi:hypothetical protein